VASLPIRLIIGLVSWNKLMAVAFEVTVTGTWSPNDVAPCTYPASAHFPDLLGTTQTENTQF